MQRRRVVLAWVATMASTGCARVLEIDEVAPWTPLDAAEDGEDAAPDLDGDVDGGGTGDGGTDTLTSPQDAKPETGRDANDRSDVDSGDAKTNGTSIDGPAGNVEADAATPIAPPRLIAPLSTSTVTTQRPTLRWELAPDTDGVFVEICRDRGCSMPVTSLEITNATSAKPVLALSKGAYFWRARGQRNAARGSGSSPTWQFTVPARSAPIDTSWGTVPDVNGDGRPEIVVGANPGGTRGRVYVYQGDEIASRGSAAPTMPISAPPLVPGVESFGCSVASAGDVNGDGYADLVIGAGGPLSPDGRAHVLLGGPPERSLARGFTLSDGSGGLAQFGMAVASGGDVNGDGYADVVVGSLGEAYLFLGGPAGPSSGPDATLAMNGENRFGWAVAGAGDVNGDGYGDIVVGTAGRSARAYVYFGGASGLSTSPAISLAGPHSGDEYLGLAVRDAGDVNGDGYADVAVQTSEFSLMPGNATRPPTSSVYVYALGATGSIAMPSTVLAAPNSAVWPTSIAGVGDVNSDGFADVLVGALQDDRVFLHFGGATGLSPMATATVFLPEQIPGFGASAARAGDIDADGVDDIVVGATGRSDEAGAAYVYSGRTIATSPLPFAALQGPDGAMGAFGLSVAQAGFSGPKARRRAGARYTR